MSRFTRREFLRALAFSGTTALAASRSGLLTNSGLAANPTTSRDGVLEVLYAVSKYGCSRAENL
jgi:hypothetical protein